MSNEQNQQVPAAGTLSPTTQQRLVRHLMVHHPLPWHLKFDWTVEVTDALGAIVIKCMHSNEANEIIELSKFLAAGIVREDLREPTP